MAAKTNLAQPVAAMMGVSLLLHGALALGLYFAGAFAGQIVPKPQAVMIARLVRLGPSRDPKLLPTLAPATRAPPVPKSKPVPTPPATPTPVTAAAAAAAAPAAAAAKPSNSQAQSARTQSALERLRKIAAGAPDGDAAGDADDALAGDRYTAEVERCMKAAFIIEGTEPLLVANRSALALVRIAASGKVIDFRLSKGSGLAAFDNAVTRAVRKCSQVPPPPADRREQLRRAGIVITFRP